VTEGTTVYLTRINNKCTGESAGNALAQCLFQHTKSEVELSVQLRVIRNLTKLS
jgi:hypothetical protein